jgi:hypothetical protein
MLVGYVGISSWMVRQNRGGNPIMGNGAIVPFFLSEPDSARGLAQEEQNKETIRAFYAQVYASFPPNAVFDLVTKDVMIHRDGHVQHGADALSKQIEATMLDNDNLHVQTDLMVATADRVVYTLDVTYTDVHGAPMRVKGLSMSRLRGGLIAETWVEYGPAMSDS